MSENLINDCVSAAKSPEDADTFPTGSGILREASAEIARLKAEKAQLRDEIVKLCDANQATKLKFSHLEAKVARLREAIEREIHEVRKWEARGGCTQTEIDVASRLQAALTGKDE